jgi:Amt family ammonium transporter
MEIKTVWILVATAMIFFMQCGFAMLEVGFTRAKNTGNVIMKNLMDFCIGAPLFMIFGFGIMFASGNAVIGHIDIGLLGDYSKFIPEGVPESAYILFEVVFCGTAATIVSGAMSERLKFSAYCIISAVISLIIYPVSGHWIWGGGWLMQLGFHDLAGSTAVHTVGGLSALVGAWVLGPRIGRYRKGKAIAIPGHNMALGALGIFVLWFAWYGFNGGSAITAGGNVGERAAAVFLNTTVSASLSSCSAMAYTWIKYKKPDVSMTLNGALAGLVAVTAGADVMAPIGAGITGICAGIISVSANVFIGNVLKIDDPVGAVGVHGCCGIFGTFMVGLFSTENGLFYTGSAVQLMIQLLGIISVSVWVLAVMYIACRIVDGTLGMRVSADEEVDGLDRTEHGLNNAYADFLRPYTGEESKYADVRKHDLPLDTKINLNAGGVENPATKSITKVQIITKQSKLEDLQQAMSEIGITGMTVSQVLGCGVQRGARDVYRGAEMGISLLPKIQVDIVVAKVPPELVVSTARRVLYTGHIGDGKIFVYTVRDAVKVRTGETGYDAMQGIDII